MGGTGNTVLCYKHHKTARIYMDKQRWALYNKIRQNAIETLIVLHKGVIMER